MRARAAGHVKPPVRVVPVRGVGAQHVVVGGGPAHPDLGTPAPPHAVRLPRRHVRPRTLLLLWGCGRPLGALISQFEPGGAGRERCGLGRGVRERLAGGPSGARAQRLRKLHNLGVRRGGRGGALAERAARRQCLERLERGVALSEQFGLARLAVGRLGLGLQLLLGQPHRPPLRLAQQARVVGQRRRARPWRAVRREHAGLAHPAAQPA
mmetsp:Transcript_22099/g.71320  ORF Transcript_22099/g.71320 Transcript_22099/m.71320 type:complete len:210 (-) Transcript_22099:119-748(-)